MSYEATFKNRKRHPYSEAAIFTLRYHRKAELPFPYVHADVRRVPPFIKTSGHSTYTKNLTVGRLLRKIFARLKCNIRRACRAID